jgi:chemotaxis protein methyltransferase CheR
LQQDIYWQDHHLLTSPPPANFEVIFLRNSLLTYYAPEIQQSALTPILSALVPGGLFCIGAKEQLPQEVKDLAPIPEAPFAFFKTSLPPCCTLDGE